MSIMALLLKISSVYILNATTTKEMPSALSSALNAIYSFFINANPIILIILGLIAIIAGKFAKYIGIIIIILGIVQLLLPYLSKIV